MTVVRGPIECARQLVQAKLVRVTAAHAVGAYLYVDTAHKTRYAIDLRTGRSVGPLRTSADIIGPSFVMIP